MKKLYLLLAMASLSINTLQSFDFVLTNCMGNEGLYYYIKGYATSDCYYGNCDPDNETLIEAEGYIPPGTGNPGIVEAPLTNMPWPSQTSTDPDNPIYRWDKFELSLPGDWGWNHDVNTLAPSENGTLYVTPIARACFLTSLESCPSYLDSCPTDDAAVGKKMRPRSKENVKKEEVKKIN